MRVGKGRRVAIGLFCGRADVGPGEPVGEVAVREDRGAGQEAVREGARELRAPAQADEKRETLPAGPGALARPCDPLLWRPPRRDTLRYSPPPVSPCQERPKKPKTAYLYFAESVRPKLLKDNPGLPVPQMAPLISARWKKTADKDKAKFEALAAKDSERCPAPLATSALPRRPPKLPGALAQAQEGARELQALRILPPVPRGVA